MFRQIYPINHPSMELNCINYVILLVIHIYKIIIYSEKDINLSPQKDFPAAGKVVIKLMDGYLDKGMIVIVDNYYTSLKLAHSLLEKKKHI